MKRAVPRGRLGTGFALLEAMKTLKIVWVFLFFFTFPLLEGNTAVFLNAYESQITRAEKHYGIPDGLLLAIARVESGRYNPKLKRSVISPWAVNVEGVGTYYESKGEALKALTELEKKGKTNFDVGLMQVNWHHHGDHLPSLDQALEPHVNIAYAARFLKNLRNSLGSWAKAVAHYHSAHPEFYVPYRQKVLKAWQDIRREWINFEKAIKQGPKLIQIKRTNPWMVARQSFNVEHVSLTRGLKTLQLLPGNRPAVLTKRRPLILTGEMSSSKRFGPKVLVLRTKTKSSVIDPATQNEVNSQSS